jgi:hypothetical protein
MDPFLKGLECHVYKLTSKYDHKIYIGSTTTSLHDRFIYHSGEAYNDFLHRSSKIYTHFDKIGWNNISITSLEKVLCYSRKQLFIHETKHILPLYKNENCLNSNIPFLYPRYNITTSMFNNSPTLYLATIANNYDIMKKVFKEFILVSLPIHLGYTTAFIHRLKFRKVLHQITQTVVQSAHIKIKRDMRDQIMHLALTQIKNNAKVLKSRASINRGRPRKIVETSVHVPSTPVHMVPTVPTVPTVPAKARGRPKKVQSQNFQVVSLTEFAK